MFTCAIVEGKLDMWNFLKVKKMKTLPVVGERIRIGWFKSHIVTNVLDDPNSKYAFFGFVLDTHRVVTVEKV